MKTKEEVEREVGQMNRWKQNFDSTVKCDWCGGSGKQYAANYGDPAMGYSENGPCDWCGGTGRDKAKIFIS